MQRSFLCQWDRTRPPRVVLPFFLYCDGLTQFSYQEIFIPWELNMLYRERFSEIYCVICILWTLFLWRICAGTSLEYFNCWIFLDCVSVILECGRFLVTWFAAHLPTGSYVSCAERRWNMLSHVVVARLLCRLVVLLCMDTGPSMLLCRLVVLSLYGHWTFYAVRWFS